mgnify:FL=1
MINNQFIDCLKLIDGITIHTGDAIGADYCHDEYPGGNFAPEAVVEAKSAEEVAAVLKLCSENDVPVTVRGAGTGQVGGSVPVKGGVVLSVKGMDKILGYNEEERTLRVQPGVLLQDVKAEAEKHGLYYPPDPGEKTATIGGNAATDAGGPCAVKYGSTKDYVLDAVIVLADGSITTLAGNEAVIGSEGTLAVICELTLKLVDKPKADAILLLPFMDTESCIKAAATVIGTGCAPAVVEYMDTDMVEFSGNVTGNPVFPVEMDGERVAATLMAVLEDEDDDLVMEQMEAIAELAEEMECLDILVGDTTTMKRDMWAAHDAFHTSMESGAKNSFEYNITVPAENIAEMVEWVKAHAGEKGMKAMAYAHVGTGGMHIHVASDADRDEFKAALTELSAAVYEKCASLGGDVRGEYGIGYAKVPFFGEKARGEFAAVKAKLDPKGILNPGKVAD